MIQEFVEIWNWVFGLMAGWGATTTAVIIAVIVLYIRYSRLKSQVEILTNRLTHAEREWSLEHNRDKF